MHREDNIGHFAMSVSTALLLDVVNACIFNQDYFANYLRRVETVRGPLRDSAGRLAGTPSPWRNGAPHERRK